MSLEQTYIEFECYLKDLRGKILRDVKIEVTLHPYARELEFVFNKFVDDDEIPVVKMSNVIDVERIGRNTLRIYKDGVKNPMDLTVRCMMNLIK